jgi:adenylosuccinate synthase
MEGSMNKYIDMVIDLQFGSTGKGLLAGWLAKRGMHDTVMTAWGPNSGHTFIDSEGRKFVHTMLANGIVGPHVRQVMIGPGSVLNLDNLLAEIESCRDIIEARRIGIFIHPHAAIVDERHRLEEHKTMTAIGSTKKGVGAATIDKILRDPTKIIVARDVAQSRSIVFDLDFVHLVRSPAEWLAIYQSANFILIEGAQGFGLSIHHGFYPYVTSRDVTPSQILADCGVPFNDSREVCVWGTCRTYPIRVANRYDDAGKQIGYSGPGFSDQIEIQWSDIGREAELTTVTKLPRRLFTFSHQQMIFAQGMCSPNVIFLNFVNYLVRYEQFEALYEFLTRDGADLIIGVGPTVGDIISGIGPNPKRVWEQIQLHKQGGMR